MKIGAPGSVSVRAISLHGLSEDAVSRLTHEEVEDGRAGEMFEEIATKAFDNVEPEKPTGDDYRTRVRHFLGTEAAKKLNPLHRRAAELYASGKRQQAIAKQLGKDQATISRWLQEIRAAANRRQ
jgi:DNA invertase Pin-like site-specific DNA recombinase